MLSSRDAVTDIAGLNDVVASALVLSGEDGVSDERDGEESND